MQLFRQGDAFQPHFLAHSGECSIQRQPCFHAHRHEIQGIGKTLENFPLPVPDTPHQPGIRQEITKHSGSEKRGKHHNRLALLPSENAEIKHQQPRQNQSQQGLRGEKHHWRRGITIARVHETDTQIGVFPTLLRQGNLGERAAQFNHPLDPSRRRLLRQQLGIIRRDALQPFLYWARAQLQQDGQGNPEHHHENNN